MKEQRIQKLREILEKDPDDSFARYALGLEFAGMGRHDHAASIFEEVLKRNPRYVPAYQQLGTVYQTLGRNSDAVEILKKGIEIAQSQGDSHAQSEMQEALDELA